MAPSSNLVEDGDGWLELDEDGVPLGRWDWDEDLGEWVFEEFPPPLAGMPKTIMNGYLPAYAAMLAITLMCAFCLQKRIGTSKSPAAEKNRINRRLP